MTSPSSRASAPPCTVAYSGKVELKSASSGRTALQGRLRTARIGEVRRIRKLDISWRFLILRYVQFEAYGAKWGISSYITNSTPSFNRHVGPVSPWPYRYNKLFLCLVCFFPPTIIHWGQKSRENLVSNDCGFIKYVIKIFIEGKNGNLFTPTQFWLHSILLKWGGGNVDMTHRGLFVISLLEWM